MSLLAINEHETEQFGRLETILGTNFTAEMFAKTEESDTPEQEIGPVGYDDEGNPIKSAPSSKKAKSSQLRMPLAFSIRPELDKLVREHFAGHSSEAMSHVPKDTQSMYDMSKEEFMRQMGKVHDTYQAQGYRKPETGKGLCLQLSLFLGKDT